MRESENNVPGIFVCVGGAKYSMVFRDDWTKMFRFKNIEDIFEKWFSVKVKEEKKIQFLNWPDYNLLRLFFHWPLPSNASSTIWRHGHRNKCNFQHTPTNKTTKYRFEIHSLFSFDQILFHLINFVAVFFLVVVCLKNDKVEEIFHFCLFFFLPEKFLQLMKFGRKMNGTIFFQTK